MRAFIRGYMSNQIVLHFNAENQYRKKIADVRSWTLNPYLNSQFEITKDMTIYSIKGDYVSGGDPKILTKYPRVKILDGKYIQNYKTGTFDF